LTTPKEKVNGSAGVCLSAGGGAGLLELSASRVAGDEASLVGEIQS
jgi:hypothetical protein